MTTLKNIMNANAISCIGFGILFIFLPEAVQQFLSASNQAPLMVISSVGAVLVFNGIHLIWASLKEKPHKLLVLYFSLGDFLWVLASAALLITGLWITSVEGIVVTIVVAMFVGAFGFLQMSKRNQMDKKS